MYGIDVFHDHSNNISNRYHYFDVMLRLRGHVLPRAMPATALVLDREYSGPPGWELGTGLTTGSLKSF
jgi:hypothetical protein